MKSQSPGDDSGEEFISDTSHFFKIILDDIDAQKLRIPKKFVRNYGSEISSSVSLKVPTGASWKVELKKCDDGTWLHNGWSEFAKHYSVSYGSFLVFRYEGNCNFHVIIFDKTATEISYPYGGNHGSSLPNGGGFQFHSMEDTNEDIPPSRGTKARSPSASSRPSKKMNSTSRDNISVDILDGIPSSKKRRVRSPSPSRQPCKKIKSTSTNCVKDSAINPNVLVDSAKRNGKRPQQMEACRRKAKLTTEQVKTLLRASPFESENPFFKIVMQPSYVYDKCYMNIPANFCEEHLPKNRGDVILTVSHTNSRSVAFCPTSKSRLVRGWKKFVKENRLDVGDVCVFELINQTTIAFNVVIFRVVQDAESVPIPAKVGRRRVFPSDLQGFASFKPENPFFKTGVQPAHLLRVNMPYYFAKKHIKQDEVNLTVENGGKMWPVKVIIYEDRTLAYLIGGWPAFAKENSLKVGEGCAFELINMEDAELRVHIFRKSAE